MTFCRSSGGVWVPRATCGRSGLGRIAMPGDLDQSLGGRLYRRLRARHGSDLCCAWFANDLGSGWGSAEAIPALADRVSGIECSTSSANGTSTWMIVPERADDWITVSTLNRASECAYRSEVLPSWTNNGVGGGKIFMILQRIQSVWAAADYTSPISVQHTDDSYDAPLVCNMNSTTYRTVWCDNQLWVNGVGPSDTPASPTGRHLIEVDPRNGEWKRIQVGSSRYVFAPNYYGGRNCGPDVCEIYAWWALYYGATVTEAQRAGVLSDCSEIYAPFSV